MTVKHRFKIDKLVRDKTKERLNARGIVCSERVMETQEYVQRLKNKLVEEAQEVLDAKTTEEYIAELADVLEVVHALATALNLSYQQVDQKRLQIKEERGGFEGRLYHADVQVSADNKKDIEYLRGSPDKYPEIL
jgi:predicted house-cleaning noncanonical NTP pyrophosphatase (MazG superfamily)